MRIFIRTPSGRKRFNVLGAVNAITKKLHTYCNTTYINSECVCEFLRAIAQEYPGKAITIFLDNARYQRCALVLGCAAGLNIDLQFLPSYSPNLNLIERCWKFIKKKTLNNRYYETFKNFQDAIAKGLIACNENTEWKKELSLLSLEFQMFDEEAKFEVPQKVKALSNHVKMKDRQLSSSKIKKKKVA